MYSFFYGQNSFKVRDIKLEIQGPEQVNSGEETTFLIKYNNKTKVFLHDVELVFENQSFKLDSLPLNTEGQIEVKTRVLGQPDEDKELLAVLHYIPEIFSSSFEARAKFRVKIISSAIIASLEAPEKVVSGEESEYILSFFSKSNEEFENLEIIFEYPDGFTLTKEPENKVASLIKDEVKTIKFKGFMSGFQDEEKEIIVRISDIAETSAKILISGSPLSLEQKVNGEVFPGQELEFILNFKNQSDLEFNDGKITLGLKGNSFDFDSIKIEDGSFDKFQKKITWTSGGVSSLKKLEDGQVSFKIKIKDKLDINTFNDKNFVAHTIGLLESKEGIKANFEKIIKINSKITFKALAFFNETAVDINNSGAIPPKANEATTYTVHWQLVNGANDLKGAIVTTSLPSQVSWSGKSHISNGNIYYDPDSNQVVWEIGDVSAHTGSLLPAQEAVFQIELKPETSQIGRLAPIVNTSVLSSQDSFTKQILTSKASALTSELVHDPTISYQQGVVVE